MAVSNEQLVREFYERGVQGRSARDLVAEDLEYVNPPDAVEGGTKRGRHLLASFRDVYEDVSFELERVEEIGDDDVLVLAIMRARAKGSGIEIETRQGYIWTVEDGQLVRFRWFSDHDQALAAAGII